MGPLIIFFQIKVTQHLESATFVEFHFFKQDKTKSALQENGSYLGKKVFYNS